MALVLLGGFLVVVAGSLGVLAGKPRDGESEDARIVRALAIAAGVVAIFVVGICIARLQLVFAADGGIITPGRWGLAIPVLLFLSLRGWRRTY